MRSMADTCKILVKCPPHSNPLEHAQPRQIMESVGQLFIRGKAVLMDPGHLLCREGNFPRVCALGKTLQQVLEPYRDTDSTVASRITLQPFLDLHLAFKDRPNTAPLGVCLHIADTFGDRAFLQWSVLFGMLGSTELRKFEYYSVLPSPSIFLFPRYFSSHQVNFSISGFLASNLSFLFSLFPLLTPLSLASKGLKLTGHCKASATKPPRLLTATLNPQSCQVGARWIC